MARELMNFLELKAKDQNERKAERREKQKKRQKTKIKSNPIKSKFAVPSEQLRTDKAKSDENNKYD